jgi:hypothetical protein
MKTRSQKWLPLSILSQTKTSNISRSKWMPTAISMALNSTHVSPSALKRDKKPKTKTKLQFKISTISKQSRKNTNLC